MGNSAARIIDEQHAIARALELDLERAPLCELRPITGCWGSPAIINAGGE